MPTKRGLSLKQARWLAFANNSYNIAFGAVRTGKTFANNLRWLKYVRSDAPHGCQLIMSGKSQEALYNNVIRDLIIQESDFRLSRSPLRIYYPPKSIEIICVGADKVDDFERIQGCTAAGWYANEVTIAPKSFIDMAITRCSIGQRLKLWDGNPGHPQHDIKRRFIDNGMSSGLDVRYKTFEFRDNPTLTEEYIREIRTSFAGVFHQRNILGLWVAGEGIIYDVWDSTKHIVPWFNAALYPQFPRYRVVDFGFALHHAFCCQRWMHVPEGQHFEQQGRHFWGPCYILYRERYHTGVTNDVHAKMITQEDSQDRFVSTFCDHDPDAIQTIRNNGMTDARMARKPTTVANGIQLLHQAISRNHIYLMDGALSHPADPALVEAGLPTCTAEEIPRLTWATTMKGQYEKEDYAPGSIEHGAKNISYLLNSVEQVHRYKESNYHY